MKKIENIDSFVGVLEVIEKLSLDDKLEQIACDELIHHLLFTCSYIWVNSKVSDSNKEIRAKLYTLMLLTGGRFINNLEK